jgi:hypothetical protein
MTKEKLTSEYYCEKLDESKIDDLLFLFNEVFHSFPPKSEIINKHLNCHGENKFIGFIAYDYLTNQPAAYHGVFPLYAMYKNEKILIAQSGDIMTHSNHQKKGLFFLLAKKTYEFCSQNGIKMIFAFPNSISYPLFINKLGFSETKKLINFTFLENKFEISRFSQKSKLIAKIHQLYVKTIFRFVSNGKTFKNSNIVGGNEYAYMLHDEEYYKWKQSSGKYFVNIKGVNCWLSISQNYIAIGDIELNNENDLPIVIRRLKILTFLLGFRFLTFGGSENAYLIKLLKGKYKEMESYTPIFLDLSPSIPHESILLLNSDVDVF